MYGDFDQAKSVAARARGRFKNIHGEPEHVERPDLLCQYGLLQILCGKPERAQFAFEKAMTVPTRQEEICQQCHEAHYGMGLLHGFCGDKDAACEGFDKAIEMSPYNMVYKTLKAKLTK
jgi:tetratricopeptide (TPR) repeat protein